MHQKRPPIFQLLVHIDTSHIYRCDSCNPGCAEGYGTVRSSSSSIGSDWYAVLSGRILFSSSIPLVLNNIPLSCNLITTFLLPPSWDSLSKRRTKNRLARRRLRISGSRSYLVAIIVEKRYLGCLRDNGFHRDSRLLQFWMRCRFLGIVKCWVFVWTLHLGVR